VFIASVNESSTSKYLAAMSILAPSTHSSASSHRFWTEISLWFWI